MPASTFAFSPVPGFWKLTALFACDRDGWSEVYYFPQDTTIGAPGLRDSFVKQRVKILGGGATLSVIRVSDTGVPRSGFKYLIGAAGEATSQPSGDGGAVLSDQCSAAVGIPFRTASGQRRFLMCSGIPDDWIIRKTALDYEVLSERGKNAIAAWKQWLLQTPWALQIRLRKPAPGNPQVNINAVTTTTDGFWQITVDGAPPWTQGNMVAITGLKGSFNMGNLRGVKKIKAVATAATTFTMNTGPALYAGTPIYMGGAKAQLNLYDMTLAQDTGELPLITTRRRGRPFSARRGRSSARK